MSFRLGPFEIQSRFASGGMGEIYRGLHVDHNVPVAIKVITGPNALLPEYQEEFRREVQAVARLNHPNIVQVFDYGTLPDDVGENADLIPGAPYLIMEYASRGSLANQLEPLNWRDLKNILMSVLGALSHAHARNVIHRDIKPGNVLLGSYHETPPRIILTDFGVAHATDAQTRTDAMEFTSRSTEEASGTPRYMAPEQFMGKWRDYGPWTDLYAVGVMAYHLACGDLPFKGATFMMLAMAHINNPFPALAPRIDVPDGFEAWVRRMAAKKPSERFHSAADAAWALTELDDSQLLFSELSAIAGDSDDGSDDFDDATDMLPTRIDFAPPESLRVFTMSKTEQRDYPDAPAIPLTWEEAEPPNAEFSMLGAGLGLFGLRSIPVVSREDIRSTLWDNFKTVYLEGYPRTVVLRGLAGTGKSRLAEWIAQLTDEIGAGTVFYATHAPTPGPTTGLGWMLTSHFRSAGLTAEDMGERVDAYLESEGVNDPTETRALTEIMRSNLVEADRTSKFMAFTSLAHRYSFIRRVLERASRQRPAVVVMDDVQWSWDSLGLVKDVLEHDEDHPIFFVLTVKDEALVERPEEQRALTQILAHPNTAEVFVDPLGEAEIADLVRAHLGLPDDLADDVASRAGGSPLFAVQLVEDWVKRGVLEFDGSALAVKRGETATLPQDLAALWQSRIDFLVDQISTPDVNESRMQIILDPDTALRGLEIAAALGRDVNVKEWKEICSRSKIKASTVIIDEMIRLRMANPLPEADGFSFINAQLWEALIRSAKDNERWVSHNMKCAQTLASLYDTEQPGLAQRIGRHFLQAKAFQLASTCLEEAYLRAYGAEEHAETEAILELLEATYEALDLNEKDGRWAELWVRRGVPMIYSESEDTYDQGCRLLDRAEKATRAAGNTPLLLSILRAQGWAAAYSATPDLGLPKLEEALELCAEDDAQLASCHRTLGYLLMVIGRVDEAVEHLELTLELAGDSVHGIWATVELAECARRKGRLEDSTTLLDAAMAAAETSSILLAQAAVFETRGLIDFERGEYAEALKNHESAFEIREMTGGRSTTRSKSWELMGRSAAMLSDYDKAMEIAEHLDRAIQSGGRSTFVHPADLMLAAAAGLKRWDLWDQQVGPALDFDQPMERWHLSVLVDAGKNALHHGEGERGQQMLEALLEKLDDAGEYTAVQVEITELLDDFEIEEELEELTIQESISTAELAAAKRGDPEEDFDPPVLDAGLGEAEDSEPDEEYSGLQIVNIADIASITDQSSGSFAPYVPETGSHPEVADPDAPSQGERILEPAGAEIGAQGPGPTLSSASEASWSDSLSEASMSEPGLSEASFSKSELSEPSQGLAEESGGSDASDDDDDDEI